MLYTILYQHSNFRGNGKFDYLPSRNNTDTYLKLDHTWFYDLNDQVSSLKFYATAREKKEGSLILFEHRDFKGRYQIFYCSPNQANEKPWIGQRFNDIASSALIVRSFPNELPIPLNATVGLDQKINSFIERNNDLYLRGKPVITWDLWPSFSPQKKFVHLKIPVEVEVPNWFNYDAVIKLWIYFYIDAQHKLKGHIARYGVWVEGGFLSNSVKNEVMAGLRSSIGDLNELVVGALVDYQRLDFERLYYLPGISINRSAGHVEDDVTMVLVEKG